MSIIIAPSRMEPARIEDAGPELRALSLELISRSMALEAMVPDRFRSDVRIAVFAASAWHSSGLEGRWCDADDLLSCLAGDKQGGGLLREVTGLAKLHEKIILEGDLGQLGDPSSPDWLKQMHGAFSSTAEAGALPGVIGEWRCADVIVGDHVPPPHDRLETFVAHFHKRFRLDWMPSQVTRVMALATAHHRLSWIHPFEDGNGRVSRMMSSAMSVHAGVHAGGLWSLPAALARGRRSGRGYHAMMAIADRPRQGDRDGRGNLSLAALESFAFWFLDACLEEVQRMERLCETCAAKGWGDLEGRGHAPDVWGDLFEIPAQ